MKSGFLFVLLIHQCISHSLYQKGLPKSLTFVTKEEITDSNLYLSNKNSPMECSLTWMDNPPTPKAFTFDNKSQSCQGFNEVYGLTNENVRNEAFMLRSYEKEGCNHVSVLEEYKEITMCMSGWFPVRGADTSVSCYRTVDPKDYNGHNVINACKEKYPFSQAASIHSEEEAIGIAEFITSKSKTYAIYQGYYGVNIGLLPANGGWKWLDGSEMSFTNLDDKKNLNDHCKYLRFFGLGSCTHVAMYWKARSFAWNYGQSKDMDVLCKYKLY